MVRNFPIGGLLLLSLSACGGGSETASVPIVTIAPAPVVTVAPAPPPVSNIATLTANLSVRQNGIDY